MPCWFCIAAVGIAATVIVPTLVDSTEQTLRTAAEDLRRVKETKSMVMWTGTFRFQAPSGEPRTAATTVTIYKDSKRARIQCLTHELPHDEVHSLQDFVANLIGATVLDRTDGESASPVGHQTKGLPSAESIPVATSPNSQNLQSPDART